MLYEFLTGELPFKGTDADTHATLLKILERTRCHLSADI